MRTKRWSRVYVFAEHCRREGDRYLPTDRDDYCDLEQSGDLLSFPGNPNDLKRHAAARKKGGRFDCKVAATLREVYEERRPIKSHFHSEEDET